MSQLETDAFLTAVRDQLITDVAECEAVNTVVWLLGDNDPDEMIKAAVAKAAGVSVLIYDLGGDADDEDMIRAKAVVELYVSPTKTFRKTQQNARTAGAIRNDIMRTLHRSSALRNTSPNYDCRVLSYQPLADPEYVAFRITITHSIYLID